MSLDVLLARMAERGRQAPPLLLCVRDSDMPPRLAAWIDAHPSQVDAIALGPLDEAGVREMLDSLRLPSVPAARVPEMAAPLMRLAGGHASVLAALLIGAGRFVEAQAMLQWALGCFTKSGPPAWRSITEHRLATLYLRLGQPAQARRALTPLWRSRPPPVRHAG